MINHYVYKITLIDSDKYYIGRRSTSKPIQDDPYLGSGVWVKGIKDKSKLRKTILEVFDSLDSLLEGELKWINLYFNDPNNMNILLSSLGNASGEHSVWYGKNHSESTKDKMRASQGSGSNHVNYGKTLSNETKNKMKLAKRLNNFWVGHNHTDSTKEKMRLAKLGKTHTEEAKKNMSVAKSGENNKAAKLTVPDVLHIRQMHENKVHTIPQLAKLYNVNVTTIRSLIIRKTWKNI